jgi:NitT/TauT family transport system permease protein
MLSGLMFGVMMGRFRKLDTLLDPWLVVLLNLPLLVIVVLSYIWVGLNEAAAILAVMLAKAPTIAVTIREGARAFNPELDEMAQVFAIGRVAQLRRILLPQLAPYIVAAARSGLAITWKIVLVVELLGRPNGVGFVLNLHFQNFDVTAILAYGLAFAMLMLGVEAGLMQPLERRSAAWRRDA